MTSEQPKRLRPREVVMKRRLEIKELIENIGLWNLDRKHLYTKYGISRQMLDKDIHHIMKGMPAEKLSEIKFNLSTAYKKALKDMQVLLATSKSPKDRISAAQALGKLGEQFTRMLESYGLKEKVADKVEHSGGLQGVVVNIVQPEKKTEGEKK